MRLNGGRVSYKDARNNTAHEISDINVKLTLPGLDKKFEGKGNLKWNGKTIELDIAANPLRNLMEQKSTELAAKITSEPVKLAYQGAATLGKQQQITGKIDLDVLSIRNLAAWAGQKIEMPGNTLGPFKVTGALSAVGDSYAFKGAKFKLDTINADGDFEANLGRAKPVIKARLTVDMLDLNPYLGETKAQPADKQQAAKPAARLERRSDQLRRAQERGCRSRLRDRRPQDSRDQDRQDKGQSRSGKRQAHHQSYRNGALRRHRQGDHRRRFDAGRADDQVDAHAQRSQGQVVSE